MTSKALRGPVRVTRTEMDHGARAGVTVEERERIKDVGKGELRVTLNQRHCENDTELISEKRTHC